MYSGINSVGYDYAGQAGVPRVAVLRTNFKEKAVETQNLAILPGALTLFML